MKNAGCRVYFGRLTLTKEYQRKNKNEYKRTTNSQQHCIFICCLNSIGDCVGGFTTPISKVVQAYLAYGEFVNGCC